MASAILAAGLRGRKATAVGEACVPAGSVAAGSEAVEGDSAAVDLADSEEAGGVRVDWLLS